MRTLCYVSQILKRFSQIIKTGYFWFFVYIYITGSLRTLLIIFFNNCFTGLPKILCKL